MSKEYAMLKSLIIAILIIGTVVVGSFAVVHYVFRASPLIILGHVEYNGIPIYVGVPTEFSLHRLKELGAAHYNQSIKVKLRYTHALVKRFSSLLIKRGDKYIIEILENDEATITH